MSTYRKSQLLLLSTLLVACSGPSPTTSSSPTQIPTPTLASLVLTDTANPVQIGQASQLSYVATGSDGLPFSGTPTFTSSNPNVLTIDAAGKLNARHLSNAPVTLTATLNGITASRNFTTYGLDFTAGTTVGSSFGHTPFGGPYAAAFRDASGMLQPTGRITITGGLYSPTTLAELKATDPNNIEWGSSASVLGTSAAATINGVTYHTPIIQGNNKLSLPELQITATNNGYQISGTLPPDTVSVQVSLTGPSNAPAGSGTYVVTPWLQTLPASGTWTTTIPSGEYTIGIVTTNFNVPLSLPLPDTLSTTLNMHYGFTVQ